VRYKTPNALEMAVKAAARRLVLAESFAVPKSGRKFTAGSSSNFTLRQASPMRIPR